MKQLKLKDALKEDLTTNRRHIRGTSYWVGMEEDGSLYIADNSDIVVRLLNKAQVQDVMQNMLNYANQMK